MPKVIKIVIFFLKISQIEVKIKSKSVLIYEGRKIV